MRIGFCSVMVNGGEDRGRGGNEEEREQRNSERYTRPFKCFKN